MSRIDFVRINDAARPVLLALVRRWLPNGQQRGNEYLSLNPNRADRRPGSFSINLRTGRWSDFATGDRGGDPVSLAAYLHGLSQCAPTARNTSGGGFHPESCRLLR